MGSVSSLASGRLLGWDDQIGSIEPGKQGSRGLAAVRPRHADRLLTADEDELTADAMGVHRKLVGA